LRCLSDAVAGIHRRMTAGAGPVVPADRATQAVERVAAAAVPAAVELAAVALAALRAVCRAMRVP
jgi:hypothetical protein